MDLTSKVAAGNSDAVAAALDSGDDALVVLPQYRGYKDVNLICLAAMEGKSEVIADLHSAQADLNHFIADGVNAFHIAARFGHPNVLRELKNLGMDVNSISKHGMNAFHIAMIYGNLEVIRELASLGIDVKAPTKRGMSAIHLAAQYGHPHVLSELITQGINLNTTTERSFNALHIAAQHGHPQVLSKLTSLGIHVDVAASSGWTALHFAVRYGKSQCVKMLADLKSCMDARDNKGITPLMLAIQEDQVECMRALGSCGADAASIELKNEVPRAAKHGKFAILKFLIEHGQDPNTKDRDGKTALDWARWNRWQQIEDWLQKWDAQHNQGRCEIHRPEAAAAAALQMNSLNPQLQMLTLEAQGHMINKIDDSINLAHHGSGDIHQKTIVINVQSGATVNVAPQ